MVQETVHFVSFSAVFHIPGLFDEYVDNLNYGLPIALFYDHHDESKRTSITNQIKEFYFDNELTRERETNLTNVKYSCHLRSFIKRIIEIFLFFVIFSCLVMHGFCPRWILTCA